MTSDDVAELRVRAADLREKAAAAERFLTARWADGEMTTQQLELARAQLAVALALADDIEKGIAEAPAA
jgi:hypothetical protein